MLSPPHEPNAPEHPDQRHEVAGEGGEDRVRHGGGLHYGGAFDAGYPRESLPPVAVGTLGTSGDCDRSTTLAASECTVSNISQPAANPGTVSVVRCDIALKSAAARTCYHTDIATTVAVERKNVASVVSASNTTTIIAPKEVSHGASNVTRGAAHAGTNYRASGGNGSGAAGAAPDQGINRGGDRGGTGDAAAERTTVAGETCPACHGSARSYHFGHLVCSVCGGSGVA